MSNFDAVTPEKVEVVTDQSKTTDVSRSTKATEMSKSQDNQMKNPFLKKNEVDTSAYDLNSSESIKEISNDPSIETEIATKENAEHDEGDVTSESLEENFNEEDENGKNGHVDSEGKEDRECNDVQVREKDDPKKSRRQYLRGIHEKIPNILARDSSEQKNFIRQVEENTKRMCESENDTETLICSVVCLEAIRKMREVNDECMLLKKDIGGLKKMIKCPISKDAQPGLTEIISERDLCRTKLDQVLGSIHSSDTPVCLECVVENGNSASKTKIRSKAVAGVDHKFRALCKKHAGAGAGTLMNPKDAKQYAAVSSENQKLKSQKEELKQQHDFISEKMQEMKDEHDKKTAELQKTIESKDAALAKIKSEKSREDEVTTVKLQAQMENLQKTVEDQIKITQESNTDQLGYRSSLVHSQGQSMRDNHVPSEKAIMLDLIKEIKELKSVQGSSVSPNERQVSPNERRISDSIEGGSVMSELLSFLKGNSDKSVSSELRGNVPMRANASQVTSTSDLSQVLNLLKRNEEKNVNSVSPDQQLPEENRQVFKRQRDFNQEMGYYPSIDERPPKKTGKQSIGYQNQDSSYMPPIWDGPTQGHWRETSMQGSYLPHRPQFGPPRSFVPHGHGFVQQQQNDANDYGNYGW